MRRRLYCALAFALLFSACLSAQNVFVLPPSSSSTVTVFGADPFAQTAVLNVTPSGILVLAGPNNKFYIISNIGNGSPTVAAVTQNPDGTFSGVKNVGSFAGALAAAITPDGRRLVVQSSGALNIVDTSNDTVLSVAFGGQILDFALSADSTRAFVVNTTTSVNQVVAVDLKTGTTITTAPVLGSPNNVTVGPTARVYVSTTGALLELDPATLATTRSIQVTGRPGKLSITPDGKLGIAVNLTTTINGTAVLVFDLNNRTLLSSIANSLFAGAIINQIVPVSNTRAIAFSSTAQALFDVTLSPVNAGPFSFAPAGTVSSFAVSNDIASGSHAGTQYLFFTSNNTLFRFDLLANQITGQQSLSSTPGVIAFAAQAITNGTPAALITYGDNQTLTLNTASGPLAVRVLDANGRPLSGVTVIFSVSASGATLSAPSAVTDSTGLAFTTLTSSVAATIPVTVTAGPLTTTMTVNVGGGPKGPSQSGCLTILSGQGQVVQPQFTAPVSGGKPLTVQCTDASGKPLGDQQIAFTIVSGPPNAQINSIVNGIGGTGGQTQTVPTDTKTGQAQVVFSNPCGPGPITFCPGFSTTVVQATAPDGSVVTFYVTTTAIPPQEDVVFPVSRVIEMSSGSKRLGAITATVSTADGAPQPIPFVGMQIINPPGSDPALPVPAQCDGGGGFALSTLITDRFGDTSGTIICDLIATGPPGRYVLFVEVGGTNDIGPFTLLITPGSPASIAIVGGDKQSGNPGQKLNTALTVAVTDASGNILPGVPVTFTVTNGSATLSAASVTTDSGGRASVSVTLGNTPGLVQIKATAGSASQNFSLTIVTPATAVQLVSGSGQSAAINSAFASPIVVRVVDANGNGVGGLTVSFIVTSGSATAATPQVVTNPQGTASTTVNAGPNPGPVVITAAAAGFSTTVSLTVLAPGPSNLVFLNGAGFQKGIAPGAIVAIQGNGLVSAQGVFVPANIIGPLPTTFQGVTITFNSIPAPIFSVSNSNGVQQVVVQVPFEVAGASTVNVSITTAGGGSTTVSNMPLQPLSPGIFDTTAYGQRQAVALHADGSYVSPANPAHKGENITIYLTGLGQTTPLLFTNSVGIAGQRVNATVTALINSVGVPIVNDSTGKPLVLAAPGLVGVYTVTIQVPADAPSGNIPLTVSAYDAANNQYTSQGSFLPIQ